MLSKTMQLAVGLLLVLLLLPPVSLLLGCRAHTAAAGLPSLLLASLLLLLLLTVICAQRLIPVESAIQVCRPVHAGIKAGDVGCDPAQAARGAAGQGEWRLHISDTP
jgi:hypothetical protein